MIFPNTTATSISSAAFFCIVLLSNMNKLRLFFLFFFSVAV